MDILPQILANGVIAGSAMALVALGLSLIYGVMRFMNFAHGEMAMLGAMFYFLFFIQWAWPIVPSILGALLVVAFISVLYNKLLFEPLRDQDQWLLMVISLGVSLFTKGAVTWAFGATAKNYAREGYEARVFEWFGGSVVVTSNQITIIVATLLILIAMGIFLKKSKLGKAIRAVSDNARLSEVVGIDSRRIVNIIFILSSSIAAFSGILLGYEQNVSSGMGLNISVYAFVAVILGGLGNVWGAVFGAFLLGVVQNLVVGLDWFGFSVPTSYKSTVAFALLIILLLFKPRGLFGGSLEEATARK